MIRRSITLHDSDYQALRDLAQRRRTNVSQLVREAISQHFSLQPQPASPSMTTSAHWATLEGRSR